MNTGRSSSSPANFRLSNISFGNAVWIEFEEAESLVFLIVELSALHPAANDVMFECFGVLTTVIERLGVSEMERDELVGILAWAPTRISLPCG